MPFPEPEKRSNFQANGTTTGSMGIVTGLTGEKYRACLVEGDGIVPDLWWMVDNSKEGNHEGEAYGHNGKYANSSISTPQTYGAKGYYYTWKQATTKTGDQYDACPEGWRMPDSDGEKKDKSNPNLEFERLKKVISENPLVAKWWTAGSAFAGYYDYNNTTWANWGNSGGWWSASALDRVYFSDASSMTGSGSRTAHWLPVRCVRNK